MLRGKANRGNIMHRVFCLAAAAAVLLALPASAQAQGREIIVPSNLQGTLICATGDTLLLGGKDTLRDFLMCVLTADRHLVPGQQQNSDPNYPQYAFRWTAETAGTHRLTVDYVLENRTTTTDHRFLVQVQDTAPVVLSALPAQFYGAASGKDLPVTVQIAPDFHAAKVEFFLDGADVGSVSAAPYGFSLPLGGVLTGPHRAFIEASDTSGDVYISPVQTVMVVSGSAPGDNSAASGAGKTHRPAVTGSGTHPPAKTKRGAGKGKSRQKSAEEIGGGLMRQAEKTAAG